MDGEDWKAQKNRRKDRFPDRQKEIMDMADDGYVVERKTDFHFRINEAVDLWPIHRRYHNIKTNKRGYYKDLKDFLKKQL